MRLSAPGGSENGLNVPDPATFNQQQNRNNTNTIGLNSATSSPHPHNNSRTIIATAAGMSAPSLLLDPPPPPPSTSPTIMTANDEAHRRNSPHGNSITNESELLTISMQTGRSTPSPTASSPSPHGPDSNMLPIPQDSNAPIISISGHYDGQAVENCFDVGFEQLGTSISSSTGSIGHGVDGLSPRDDAIYNTGMMNDNAGSGGKKTRRESSPSPIGNHLSVSPRLDASPHGSPSPSNPDMSAHIKDLFLGLPTAQPTENFIRAISPMHSASDFLDLHYPASCPSNQGKFLRSHSGQLLKMKSRSVDDISELHTISSNNTNNTNNNNSNTDNRSESSPGGSPIPESRSYTEEFIHDMGGMEGLPELSLESHDSLTSLQQQQHNVFSRQNLSSSWSQSQPQLQQFQATSPQPISILENSNFAQQHITNSPSASSSLIKPSPPTSLTQSDLSPQQQQLQLQQNFATQHTPTSQETHLSFHSSPQLSHSVEHPHGEHPSRTLFVRNINSTVEDEELRTLFETYGPIRHMYTQCKHRGFVMISYYDIRDAKNAMRHLQGTSIRRRKIDIHYSIPKENPSEKDQNQGTLVVFNLDPSIENNDLLAVFQQYGEVKEIRETPNKRHHRFIEYYDIRDAEKALKFLNKTEIRGKRIKIEPSRPGGARKAFPYQWNAGNEMAISVIGDAVPGGDFTSAFASLSMSQTGAVLPSDAHDIGTVSDGAMRGSNGDPLSHGHHPMNSNSPQQSSGPIPHVRESGEFAATNSTNSPSLPTRPSLKSLPLPIPEQTVWQPAPPPSTLAAFGGYIMATPPYLPSVWHVAQRSPQIVDSTYLQHPSAAAPLMAPPAVVSVPPNLRPTAPQRNMPFAHQPPSDFGFEVVHPAQLHPPAAAAVHYPFPYSWPAPTASPPSWTPPQQQHHHQP